MNATSLLEAHPHRTTPIWSKLDLVSFSIGEKKENRKKKNRKKKKKEKAKKKTSKTAAQEFSDHAAIEAVS